MKKVIYILLFVLFCSFNLKQIEAKAKKIKTSAISQNPDAMILIASGYYKPLYYNDTIGKSTWVDSFYISKYPVTNLQFLLFVKNNPEWQKSKVKRIFADQNYLKHWKNDTIIGDKDIEQSPVVNISWFAAKAYCRWKNYRLPSTDEWEYVAAADSTSPNATNKEEFRQLLLDWYSKSSTNKIANIGTTFVNYYGLSDMHGLVWEWVEDFNNTLVTGESRGNNGLQRELFCGSASLRSSNFKDYASFMRFGLRTSLKASYTVSSLGFRCAKDLHSNIKDD